MAFDYTDDSPLRWLSLVHSYLNNETADISNFFYHSGQKKIFKLLLYLYF